MAFNILTDHIDENIIKARYFNDGRVKVSSIARDIIQSMHLITIIDNEEILYYEDGIYKHNGIKKVKEVLILRLGDYIKKYHIGEVISQIQGRTYISRDKINTQHRILHLNNGIYNMATDEFGEFDPAIYATNKIPIDYNPDATCPSIDKFLGEVLTEGDIPIIYELFGYCLYRGYPLQYAFMFNGSGSNGKSVLINLFKSFVGNKNVSNISLQDLGMDKFAGSELFDKMVNLYPDLSDKGLKNTGIFKALTGGDGIDVQRKFQERFHLDNNAKMIFSCNTLPKTDDNTDAFFRRWIIIDFLKKFTGKNADKFLIDKLTTPEELSGLLNRSIVELAKIIESGEFTYSNSTQKTKERWIRMSDSIMAFVLDCIDADPDIWITKEDFFNSYCAYCRAEEMAFKSKKSVGSTLPTFMDIIEKKVTTDNGRKEAWMGMRFKDGCEFGKNQAVNTDSVENEENEEHSLDNYEDDEQLSQHDRMNIIRYIFINNPDGITEKELLIKIDGRMDKGEFRSCIRHYKERGNVVQMGDIYQWYED